MIDGASFKRMSPNYRYYSDHIDWTRPILTHSLRNRNFVDAESEGGVGSPE